MTGSRHTVVALCAAAIAVAAVAGCSSQPEQSPPGERPCPEGVDATDKVVQLQLIYGPGATDPDGKIVDALDELKGALRTRAGESVYFSAQSYNAAADNLASTIEPLSEAYENEDDRAYFAARSAYSDAERAYSSTCSS